MLQEISTMKLEMCITNRNFLVNYYVITIKLLILSYLSISNYL